MKYSINGVSDSEVIQFVDIISNEHGKSAIDVTYLDGKKDRVVYNSENYNKILDIMIEQAKKYTLKKDKEIKDLKSDKKFIVWVDIISFILILLSFFVSLPIVTTIGSLSLSFILSIVGFPIINNKIKDLEKYAMYLDNFEKDIEEYNKIIVKEEQLGKTIGIKEIVNKNLHDITDLDKYSLNELKEIREKVVRYKKIVAVSEFNNELTQNELEKPNQKKKIKDK